MLSKGRLAILLASVTFFAQFSSGAKLPGVSSDWHIVEVASHAALARFTGGGGQHRFFYDVHAKREVRFDVHKQYNASGIFLGSVIRVQKGEDVSPLLGEEGVVAVRPVRTYLVPRSVEKTSTGPSNTTTPSKDTSTAHIMTGIDKVHAQGITGKGIRIALIDTGVDYRHPYLGGGFGGGHKIAGGYDFVGDNFNQSNSPVPDDDPLDVCDGHGTQTAGVIGMNSGNIYGVSGVAPDAELYAYRIMGCFGYTDDTVVVEALLRAHNDGADIINLSLGGTSPQDATGVVADRIARDGTIVIAAYGNSGVNGPWMPSLPAAAEGVIAVGSVDNVERLTQTATVFINGQEGVPVPYYSLAPLVNGSTPFEIYPTSTNTSVADDACDPLPETTPDLSNRVVVIRYSLVCTTVEQFQNAAKFGARYFLVYSPKQRIGNIETGGFSGYMIQASAGDYLVDNFAQGNKVTISFKDRLATLQNQDSGGLASYFTSVGPTYDLSFKPQFCGVGGDIISTFPNSSFKLDQGTSFSAPQVAGAAALILQAKGKTKETAFAMKDLLGSTASSIASNLTGTKPLQALIVTGAGLIQVDKAIGTTTLVSPGYIALNDTAHFQPIQSFTVTNRGTEPMIYYLSNAPAGTLHTFDSEGRPTIPPYILTTEYATVEFSQAEFTVDPGQSKTITAKFTAPAIEEDGTYPAYSGHIVITSPLETLTVSYFGIVGSIYDKSQFGNSDSSVDYQLPALQLPDGGNQNGTRTYTFNGDDFPTLLFVLNLGSLDVSLDLVAATSSEGSDPKVVGAILNSEGAARSTPGAPWVIGITETLADNTTMADGEYRALLKVLRVFGDPNNPKDMETYLSPPFIKLSANGTAAQP